MAWWYMTSLRCPNQFAAWALVQKYAGQTFVFNKPDGALGAGEVCRLGVEAAEKSDGAWWVDIVPHTVSDSGITTEEERERSFQYDNVIYGLLRNDRVFDYGITGVEVEEFRTLDDLKKEICESDPVLKNLHGLMVSTALLMEWDREKGGKLLGETAQSLSGKKEGSPPEHVPFPNGPLIPFSNSHFWIPKRKEKLLR